MQHALGEPLLGIAFGIHIGPQNISIDDLRRLWTYADTHGLAGNGRD